MDFALKIAFGASNFQTQPFLPIVPLMLVLPLLFLFIFPLFYPFFLIFPHVSLFPPHFRYFHFLPSLFLLFLLSFNHFLYFDGLETNFLSYLSIQWFALNQTKEKAL